ncbi:MAG TPA: hypothetical protein VGL42_08015 [Opitutaceae bacterium]|jgi:hypothetical protein
MPNQLAQDKRRQSLAEHAAVLAALASIAEREETTVMDLLRSAARQVVRERAAMPERAEALRSVVFGMAPKMPLRFKTSAQLARFKRAQRDFDRVLIDLNLSAPIEVQARNSIVPANRPIRLINFASTHATSI